MHRLSFLLLILMSLTSPGRAADELAVRVMSFNLRYINSQDTGAKSWAARRDAVAGVIRRDASDFVGVQEAFRRMLDDVRARVPGYGELGVGREDGKQKGEYAAILYREAAWESTASGTFWLSDTPDVAGSCSWGNQVTRICTWGRFRHKVSGAEVFVFNAHFDHQSQPSREKAAALILQRLRDRGSPAPVIFTGDLNASPDNPAVALLQKGPPALTDAWLSLHGKSEAASAGTFHDFSGRKDGGHIDYIFSTPEFTIADAAIVHDQTDGNCPSDHFPVRALLKLPAAPVK